jgi:hypothetical protein
MAATIPSICVALLLGSAPSGATGRPTRTSSQDCIKIAHIGSHDSPVGSLQICLGERGKSRADDILMNEWSFEFDAATFQAIRDFTAKQSPPKPPQSGPIEFGTFLVTLGTKSDQKKMIMLPSFACRYFAGLAGLSPKADNPAFSGEVEHLRRRLQCGA